MARAMADDFTVRFELDVAQATQNANRLAQSLGQVTSALESANVPAQQVGNALGGTAQAARQTQQSTRALGSSLPTLRYALYDVASTLGIVGGAFLGANVAALGFAVSWERSFANVIRTSGAVGPQIEQIRDQLVGLTRELPVSFTEITEIATLGGQLGIAADDLDEFSSVVARLTATTNLSAEAAGTALGRFQALMGVPASEFENLASAILNVGVNSVATESQIVAISTQISSMGAFAGLSAAEVVGLAGALASVGAQPELSRGTITRTFVQMSRAVSQGGERLSEFARVAGVTADEFRASFGTGSFGEVFLGFIEGITREGRDAVQTLNNLGITSVRDVPLLQRLALAQDEVRQAFVDSVTAYQNAQVLQEQYGVIAETTASRLKILTQGFEELLATVGGAGTGPLKEFVNFLIDSLNGLTDFLNTDFGQGVSLTGIVLTGLIGVLALVGAGVATLGATIAANLTVWQAFTGQAISLNGVLATTGSLLRGVALAVGLVAAAVAAGAGLSALGKELGDAIYGTGVENAFNRLDENIQQGIAGIENFRFAIESGRGYIDFEKFISGVLPVNAQLQALFNLDEEIARIAQSGNVPAAMEQVNRFVAAFAHLGVTSENVLDYLPATRTAFEQVSTATGKTTEEMEQFALAQEEAALAAEALANKNEILAGSFKITGDELESLSQSYVKAMGEFGNIGDILKRSQEQNREWAESVAEDTGNAKDSWEDYYDGVSVGLEQFMAGLQEDMLAQAQFATNIATLMATGYTSFAAAALEAGMDAAQVVSDALVAGPEQLQTIEDSYRQMARVGTDAWFKESSYLIQAAMDVGDQAGKDMIAAIASGDPQAIQDAIANWEITIPFESDFSSVDAAYLQHKAMWEEPITKTIWLNVEGAGGDFGVSAWNYYADGGPIYGPGTATSDSIPAMLSNGEYVIRAASVRKYGTGVFDALNRGVAKFASGGPVGGGMSFPSSMVTEFGPQSMAAVRGLGGGGGVTVVLDDVAIAQAANRGNAKLVGQGVR